MKRKRWLMPVIAVLLFAAAISGCGRTLDVLGDLADISMADTGKEEDTSDAGDDGELPRVTVKPTRRPDSDPTPTPTSVPAEEPEEMVYCISPVNVRDAASTQSNVIGTMSAGDAAEKLGQEGGWVKIRFEGREAYVYQDYVSGVRPDA